MHTGGEPFQSVANDLLAGKLPYRDRILEYPPYSILVFLLPRCTFGPANYLGGFMLLAFLADCIIKVLLIQLSLSGSKTWRAVLPVLLYSAATFCLEDFFLFRYDVWPALVCLFTASLTLNGRWRLAGLTLAFGIGLKLYPVIFLLPLGVYAWRHNKLLPFLWGLSVGVAPIIALSWVLPWWRFAQFQGARGLQVESLYASVLWMAKCLGLVNIAWEWTTSWFEVRGPLASLAIPFARTTFYVITASSILIAARHANYCELRGPADLGRLLLIPLLGFVSFNLVLSPQYIIWILPLAALVSLDGEKVSVFLIFWASALTPLFYPSRNYDFGLNPLETAILLYRNILLIIAWFTLCSRSLTIIARRTKRAP